MKEKELLQKVAEKIAKNAEGSSDAHLMSDALMRVFDKIAELEEEEEVVAILAILSEPEPDDSELKEHDLTCESWREYDMPGRVEPYRIYSPVKLYTRPGGTTHRIVDINGKIHCIPFPGNGTVLRWMPKDPENPAAF